MRIIAGKARGLRLQAPPGLDTRPTPDMARQALFNILQDRIAGACALDLFAGTGAIGLEALSRGAGYCVFVEKSPRAASFLRANISSACLDESAHLLQRDVLKCAADLAALQRRFDIVFAGPPFPMLDDATRRGALMALLDVLAERGLLNPEAAVIVQHDRSHVILERTARLRRTDRRNYGRNWFTFYAPIEGARE